MTFRIRTMELFIDIFILNRSSITFTFFLRSLSHNENPKLVNKNVQTWILVGWLNFQARRFLFTHTDFDMDFFFIMQAILIACNNTVVTDRAMFNSWVMCQSWTLSSTIALWTTIFCSTPQNVIETYHASIRNWNSGSELWYNIEIKY